MTNLGQELLEMMAKAGEKPFVLPAKLRGAAKNFCGLRGLGWLDLFEDGTAQATAWGLPIACKWVEPK